jgi:arsenate reductase
LDKLRIYSKYQQGNEMSDSIKIYHNPRCSKSRAAMELLTGNGIEAEVVKYLDTPPDREDIESLLDMLGIEPRELMRKGESEYSDNNLSDELLTRDQLIDAMLKFPRLIERPIVVKDGKAAIGRPIQNIIDIL